MYKCFSSLLFVVAITNFSTYAQDAAKPKTKLESFLGQDGVVIVHGFSTIGTVKGSYGSTISVDSKEFTNPSSGRKEYGITVEVKETGRLERENTSYVDYDEIESLLKGLEYINKIDKSVTKLNEFQADYRSKSDLRLSTFSSSNGETQLAIRSGTIGAATAYFKKDQIKQIQDLIVNAKQKIDSIK